MSLNRADGGSKKMGGRRLIGELGDIKGTHAFAETACRPLEPMGERARVLDVLNSVNAVTLIDY